MDDILDFIAKTVGDMRQEQVSFLALYNKHEDHLVHHDKQILQLQNNVGLAV